MLRLQIRDEPDQFVKLSASVSIGSDGSNDLVIPSPSVSDFHAEILVENDQLAIVDLLSVKGTYVNGRQITQKTAVNSWDVIRLGTVELQIFDPNSCQPGQWGLQIKSNALSDKVYPLEQQQITVGRDAQCDLHIDSNLLSRKHARLIIDGDKLRVQDLDSTNGTFINGKRIQEGDAYPGDELRFDRLSFTVLGPTSEQDAANSDETVARDPAETVFESSHFAEFKDNSNTQPDATQFADSTRPRAYLSAKSARLSPEASPQRSAPLSERGLAEPIALERVLYRIGRSANCEIPINDSSISKVHAILRLQGDHWQIEDQNSSNGLSVNDQPVTTSPLRSGDIIKLGRIELQFHTDKAAASQADATVLEITAPESAAAREAAAAPQTVESHPAPRAAWKTALGALLAAFLAVALVGAAALALIYKGII